jgi:hypothetical protein
MGLRLYSSYTGNIFETGSGYGSESMVSNPHGLLPKRGKGMEDKR